MSFWNKVQSGVSRAAAEAEKQTKITRINLQINEVQGNIRRKHQELGEAALRLIREETWADASVDPIVTAIGEQETRLTELKEQLAEVQGGTPAAAAEAGASAPSTEATSSD